MLLSSVPGLPAASATFEYDLRPKKSSQGLLCISPVGCCNAEVFVQLMVRCGADDCRQAGLQTTRQSLTTSGAGQCQAAALLYLPHQSLSGTRWTLLCLIPPLRRQRPVNSQQPTASQIQQQLLLETAKTRCISKLLLIRTVHTQLQHLDPLPLLPLHLLPLPPHHLALLHRLLPPQMAVSQLRCRRGHQGSQMHSFR